MKSEKQYHVIVVIQEIGIWEYDMITKKIVQIDSIKWEDLLENENTD